MTQHWRATRLGDVLEIQNGYAFDSKAFTTVEGVPLIRIRDLKSGTKTETRYAGEYDEKYLVATGDLLVGMDGEFGCYEWGGGRALLNQRVCRLQGFAADLIPRFLFHGLNSHLKAIEDVTGFTTVKHLSSKQILNINFPVPSLSEQRRIVGILDEAFAGIATAKANAEKNLQNARALFDGLLQSAFNERGDGWEERALSEICEISSSLVDPRRDDVVEHRHIGAGNIVSKTGQLIDVKTSREEGLISGKFLFDETMVLYSKIRPYLMKVARPDFRGLCSADIYPLSPRAGQLDRDFLFHLLLTVAFTDFANAGSARAGMPKVNRDHLFSYRVHIPPLPKQREIAAKLDSLWAQTKRLEAMYERKIACLDDLKKSLLHQAFSGAL